MYKLLTAVVSNVQSGDTRPGGISPKPDGEINSNFTIPDIFVGILIGITITVATILLVMFVKTLIDYSKENKKSDDKKE